MSIKRHLFFGCTINVRESEGRFFSAWYMQQETENVYKKIKKKGKNCKKKKVKKEKVLEKQGCIRFHKIKYFCFPGRKNTWKMQDFLAQNEKINQNL